MKNKQLEQKLLTLKMELITVILGYEKELLKCNREDISEFSKGCMERYFELSKEIKEKE